MADNSETAGDALLAFKVKTSGDKSHSMTMAPTATVLDLKTKLATEEFENIPVERQRLIYSGRVMKNDDTLSTYKIKAGNTIHMVKSAASNPTPAPAAASSAPTPAAVPQNMAAGTSANNLLAGLTGARFAGHANLPSMDLFGADGGMGAPPSDEQMADMLSNPSVAQGMNEALNNPAFVDHLIQSNPMLANTPNARELIQSPFFRQMMTNPDALRAAARMRRMMGGEAGQEAFPAPGATDTTPAGDAAPAANNADAANPFAGLFGPGAAAGGANPFAALMGAGNPFMPPAAAAGAQAQAATGTGNASATAPAGAAQPQSPDQAQNQAQNQQANPFAALFPAWPQAGAQAGSPANAANPFGMPALTPEMLQQMAQLMGGGGAAAPQAPPDNRPPEERYADQLRQLNDMGFFDFDRNVAALRRSGGSVQGAIEHLLGGS